MKQILDYERAIADPAIPILKFSISYTEPTSSELLTGIIDTGSDASSIPTKILKSIGAERTDTRYIKTIVGTQIPVDLYTVIIQIDDFKIYGIEVVENKQTSEIIIGRDILNQLIVELNGLAQVTTISDRIY